jgi:hypothetical protein
MKTLPVEHGALPEFRLPSNSAAWPSQARMKSFNRVPIAPPVDDASSCYSFESSSARQGDAAAKLDIALRPEKVNLN